MKKLIPILIIVIVCFMSNTVFADSSKNHKMYFGNVTYELVYDISYNDIITALGLAIEHIERMKPKPDNTESYYGMIVTPDLSYITPAEKKREEAESKMKEAERLKFEAEQIEKCDKDLKFIKKVLENLICIE